MNYALRVSLSSSKRFPILMKSMYFVQEGDVSIKEKGLLPEWKNIIWTTGFQSHVERFARWFWSLCQCHISRPLIQLTREPRRR